MVIEWHDVTVEYDPTDDGGHFTFDGAEHLFSDYLAARNPVWGDMPSADYWERVGVIGYSPRGLGNADTYMYVIRHDEYYSGEYQVALVDNANKDE